MIPKIYNDNNVLTGVDDSSIDREVGKHQTIAYYEVAAGTGRQNPASRENIHPFINVGLNKTWTFDGLTLVAKAVTYYMTVRAYSINTAMVEVTSNGVKAGYGASILKFGDIEIPE